jgi:hypothetical protein
MCVFWVFVWVFFGLFHSVFTVWGCAGDLFFLGCCFWLFMFGSEGIVRVVSVLGSCCCWVLVGGQAGVVGTRCWGRGFVLAWWVWGLYFYSLVFSDLLG